MNRQDFEKAKRVAANLSRVEVTFVAADGTRFAILHTPTEDDRLTDILTGVLAEAERRPRRSRSKPT